MKRENRTISRVLGLGISISLLLQLTGCNKSELAKVNAQQLTAEEQANIALILPFAKAVANLLDSYNSLMDQAAKAKDIETANNLEKRAEALLERERTTARRTVYKEREWRQIVPDSMADLARAYMNCRAAGIEINRGGYVPNDELLRLFREFQRAEREFRTLTKARPLQPAGTSSASVYLYITVRNTPIIYEATRDEIFIGPTVKMGPFDVNPVVGPIGTGKGGTPLQRLVIRDPATKTQRIWMLNNRMPKLAVPASYIEAEGSDLIITPR